MAWLSENIPGTSVHDDYVSGALTVGTIKREWTIQRPSRIKGIRINSGGAGSGAGSSTIDILKNGVSIFTTKPTIASASTGDWTVVTPDAGVSLDLAPGDTLRYDVTGVPATSGHTRTNVTILTHNS